MPSGQARRRARSWCGTRSAAAWRSSSWQGDKLPFVGLAVGALVALAVATALRHVRAGAVKAGGDLRGTAVIEDGAGIVGSSAGLVPFVGFLMAIGAGALVYRARRREQEKYKGLRVLR